MNTSTTTNIQCCYCEYTYSCAFWAMEWEPQWWSYKKLQFWWINRKITNVFVQLYVRLICVYVHICIWTRVSDHDVHWNMCGCGCFICILNILYTSIYNSKWSACGPTRNEQSCIYVYLCMRVRCFRIWSDHTAANTSHLLTRC